MGNLCPTFIKVCHSFLLVYPNDNEGEVEGEEGMKGLLLVIYLFSK